MSILERLNSVNNVKVYSVEAPEFASFGRILKGFDFSELLAYMENCTSIPENGNVYIASVPEMEKLAVTAAVQASVYGGMPIQVGYCNGRNTTYNGFEYHKGSEINIAVNDFCLILGHTYDIKNNHYNNDDATVFFVKKGTAIEMFQTTLHLSPARVCDEGFRDIVILPKGTNTPLTEEEKAMKAKGDPESVLLLQRNKWVIAHPERKPLIDQGAFPGIIGENKELHY